jgi:hypothetical protein
MGRKKACVYTYGARIRRASYCCRSKTRIVHGPLGEVRPMLPTAEKLLHLVLPHMIGRRQATEAWLKIGGQIRDWDARTSWTRIWPADWIMALDSPANGGQQSSGTLPSAALQDAGSAFLLSPGCLFAPANVTSPTWALLRTAICVGGRCRLCDDRRSTFNSASQHKRVVQVWHRVPKTHKSDGFSWSLTGLLPADGIHVKCQV